MGQLTEFWSERNIFIMHNFHDNVEKLVHCYYLDADSKGYIMY